MKEEMDAKVLEAVRAGVNRAGAVQGHLGLVPDQTAMRLVDRSLQRLRKRGAIKYASNTGWSAA